MSGNPSAVGAGGGAGAGGGGGGSGATGATPSAPLSPRVAESAWIQAPAASVWKLLRGLDMAVIDSADVASCAVEEGPAARVGSLRRVTQRGGGVQLLKLDHLSDARRTLEWELVSADPPPAYASATSTLCVRRVTDSNTALVQWTTLFSSDATVDVVAAGVAQARRAFTSLRSALEGAAFVDNVEALRSAGLPASCNHVMMGDAFPLEACIKHFVGAGGNLLLLDPEAPAATRTQFLLAPTDIIYPVCSSGQNRSQVLRELLLQRTRSSSRFKGEVKLAHAALAGVDPYVDDAMSATVSTADIDRDPGFTTAFGHPRDKRAGEEEYPFGGFYEAGDPFLVAAKSWFNKNYFSRPSGAADGVRSVYLTFDKPVHGVLKRLVEAHHATGSSLEDVYVVAIPLGDIIAHPPEGIARNSPEAMQHALQLFEGLLDFSKL